MLTRKIYGNHRVRFGSKLSLGGGAPIVPLGHEVEDHATAELLSRWKKGMSIGRSRDTHLKEVRN